LALLKVMDDIIRSGESRITLTKPLIDEILVSMHEEVGYNLMRSWSLPETYANISIHHHRAEFDTGNILLAVVRLANETCRKTGKDIMEHSEIALIACPEVQVLGVKEITLAELEIVVEDAGELDDL
jgi:HD-like signal output (HDOD) protein